MREDQIDRSKMPPEFCDEKGKKWIRLTPFGRHHQGYVILLTTRFLYEGPAWVINSDDRGITCGGFWRPEFAQIFDEKEKAERTRIKYGGIIGIVTENGEIYFEKDDVCSPQTEKLAENSPMRSLWYAADGFSFLPDE